MASLFAAPLIVPPAPAEEEPWNDRMARLDVGKGGLDYLTQAPCDTLLIDFVDDVRHPLVLDGAGGAAMRTLCFEQRYSALRTPDWRNLKPSSNEFWDRWVAGLQSFAAWARHERHVGRLVLNAVQFASCYEDGEVDPAFADIAASCNPVLDRMHEAAGLLLPDAAVIAYPPELFRAARQHRWGQAAYHYTEPFYEHTRRELERI